VVLERSVNKLTKLKCSKETIPEELVVAHSIQDR